MSTDRPAQSTLLLTGGRAPVTLELARAFAGAGWRVIVAESLAHHLCRHSRAVDRSLQVPPPNSDPTGFIAALERIITEESVSLLIPTCEEIFWVARDLGRLQAHCRVLAEPLERLRGLHSKWTFIQTVAGLGLTVPHTDLIQSPAELEDRLASRRPDEGLVLKPVFSRFASRVVLLRPGQVITPSQVVPMPSEAQPWVAQAFVEGQQYCTYSIAHSGRLTAHAAYGTQFTAGQGACISFVPADRADLEGWVARFVAGIGFTGQIAFDFIVTEEGVIYPLECNPRATSGIHLLPPDGLVRAICDPESPLVRPAPSARAMLGMAMLLYGRPLATRERFQAWWKLMGSAQDAIYRRDDPRPFFDQFRMMAGFWQTSRARGIGLTEATTADIEWNGDA